MNLAQARLDVLDYLKAGIPVALWGASGIGKTELVESIARQDLGMPLVDVRTNLIESVDVNGLPHIRDDRSRFARPAFLPDVPSIIFWDEFNQGQIPVLNALMQVVLTNRAGEHALPAGTLHVVAGNRRSDRAAVQRVPGPLLKRFAHIDCDPDVDTWSTWAESAGISPVLCAFMRFRPALLCTEARDDERAAPNPRAWSKVNAILPGAPDARRLRLVAGIIGEGPAAEFEAFFRAWRALPDINAILRDPDGAPAPANSEPATHYAIAGALARRADRGNFANVLRYMGRLPRDFEIMVAIDAVKRDPSLTETAAFVAWAQRNQDVTL